MTDSELEDIKKVAGLDFGWDKLSGKTVLISGGTGFIGSFICEVLKFRNEKYGQAIKIVSLTRRGGFGEGVNYIKCDVSAGVPEVDADFVLHLASATHPAQYAAYPVETITGNVFGCYNLLKSCKRGARFLLASSVEIYGDGEGEPISENFRGRADCNSARSGYNEAKRVCETLCRSYSAEYGVDFVIARLSRVFGADKKADSKAMAQFMANAVEGRDITLKSNGSQRFSYCYVADAASGILKILLDGKSGETYNVAGDDEGKTLRDYAAYIASLGGGKLICEYEYDAAASTASYAVLDCSRLKSLGWSPLFGVSEGLERTYRILKSLKNGN